MNEQDPKQRITNFLEVSFGFSEKEALKEAERCLECKNPLCVSGCPVQIDIPGFIKLIKEKQYVQSAALIKMNNFFPAVCGRVCPQENQCEKACILKAKGCPIPIGHLERFVADQEQKHGMRSIPDINDNGKRVAIIGSGPSGLTCAGDLRLKGYGVTVFEALHKLGGVMVYGIPEFRLPNSIVDKEIEYLQLLGVEFKLNYVIGKIFTIEDLFEQGYDAVFIAIGAGSPSFMKIEGEDLNFVYSANEFLTRVNLMKAYQYPKVDTPIWVGDRVAVIGGGNTAMDAARSAKRLGPKVVSVIYRRAFEQMPARLEEVRHAEEESIEFHFLTTPLKFKGNQDNNVKKMVLQKMELGKPDESGRQRPVPLEGSEYTMDVDSVIIAIGTRANPLLTSVEPQIKLTEKGYIIVDDQGRTTMKNVYAGGDITTGSATVIKAMGAGKQVAEVIDTDLKKM